MASRDTIATHRNDLISFYFNEFIGTVQQLGHRGKLPTQLDLRVELLRCSVMELLHALAFMSIQFVDTKAIDFNQGGRDPAAVMADLVKKSAGSVAYQDYLKATLKRMLVQGTLTL